MWIIGIDYDEDHPQTYRGVVIHRYDNAKGDENHPATTINSGDILRDLFEAGMLCAGKHVAFSSSVDNFYSDARLPEPKRIRR